MVVCGHEGGSTSSSSNNNMPIPITLHNVTSIKGQPWSILAKTVLLADKTEGQPSSKVLLLHSVVEQQSSAQIR
eukprot:242918-Amphidinium_carterae.1